MSRNFIYPPDFGYCSTNLAGTPNIAALGTALTAGASNADGTAVELIADLTHDVEYMIIGASGFFTSATNVSTLLDILVDRAGGTSWESEAIIPDLLVGEIGAGTVGVGIPIWYHFPVWLPAGCSIGARARTAKGTTQAGQIILHAYGGNRNPGSWWCGRKVEAIGITAASSQGQDHVPATGISSWTNLGSPITSKAGAIQFGTHGSNTDTANADNDLVYEFGVASTAYWPVVTRAHTSTESGAQRSQMGPIFTELAAGTQLMVRCKSRQSPGGLAFDVAAYVVQ